MYDTVIRNGTLVTPDGAFQADLGITGEQIAAIGPDLRGREEIDAAGKLVIPGGIDPHVHLQMPAGAVTSSDDWYTGTVAAACGGTTTVIDFVEPAPTQPSPVPTGEGFGTPSPAAAGEGQGGGLLPSPAAAGEGRGGGLLPFPAAAGEGRGGGLLPFPAAAGEGRGGGLLPFPAAAGEGQGGGLLPALVARRAEAEGKAVIDYGLHMTLLDANPATLAEIPAVIAAGVTSFKVYTTYSLKLTDDQLVAGMAAVGEAGGIVLTHAENDAGIAFLRQRLLDAGHVAPSYHPRSRPAGMEAEAIERVLALGDAAGCPIYIVHTSTARGADAITRARSRGQAAYGETCPQYLLLTEMEYDRPGFEGAKFVCSPPLRTAEDQAALWAHLAVDDLSTVGTDHCPFFYHGQKDLGRPDAPPPFNRIPGGLPGIEGRLALLYTYGVGTGRLSLERWIEVCCTAPARIFGLAGRKGSLAVGADADVVIFDPDREVTLSRAVLHEHCDYTPYEGCQLKGYPVLTMLRGRVIARDGQFVGEQGGGRFLARRS